MLIKKRNLADELAARLVQKISDGEFAVGDKLPTEPELMAMFGVGRSTVREAIRNLSQTGLVRVQQGVGTFVEKVRPASDEPLSERLVRAKGLELNEIRQLIELKIAEKAAENRSDEDIEVIAGHLKMRGEMALANIPDKCIQADINFHLSIAIAAKSEFLLELYKTIAEHLQSYFLELYINTESFVNTQHMHEALLQSIVDQEPARAWEWAAKITGQPL
ncbi:MAG TPA: GntR family transcriptional regulator [Dyadobacter sp.]|jgi:DNA-binding FadR family transcriptional regulator|nr:GntR family transcriptional regulator [Dyadobacter sp.]